MLQILGSDCMCTACQQKLIKYVKKVEIREKIESGILQTVSHLMILLFPRFINRFEHFLQFEL